MKTEPPASISTSNFVEADDKTTLEFKVGDRVKHVRTGNLGTVAHVFATGYHIKLDNGADLYPT